jgi:hypothetical protein
MNENLVEAVPRSSWTPGTEIMLVEFGAVEQFVVEATACALLVFGCGRILKEEWLRLVSCQEMEPTKSVCPNCLRSSGK